MENKTYLNMVDATINRPLNVSEIKELLEFMENQDTTDAFKNTKFSVNGNYAKLELEFDEEGNITVF